MSYRKPMWMGIACALSLSLSAERAEARGGFGMCLDPVVDLAEPSLNTTSNSIEVRYRDVCYPGETTTLYGRAGVRGARQVVASKSTKVSRNQWITATHSGLIPNGRYCFYAETVYGTTIKRSAEVCKTTEPIRCGAPVIGGLGESKFPVQNATRIDVQYHDQCSGEESTRVYHRAGESGGFSLIKSEGYNQGGWRTASLTGLEPYSPHCFYVETTVDGHIQKSPVECTSTPPPACAAPRIGSTLQGRKPFPTVTPDEITVQYTANCNSEIATVLYGRKKTDSEWALVRGQGPAPAWPLATHSGLTPDTEYCYMVMSTGPDNYVQQSGEMCQRTPVSFEQPGLHSGEANNVLERFDWHHAGSVMEEDQDGAILYYVNVLLKLEDVTPLRKLGAHLQATPLFAEELEHFSVDATVVQSEADGSLRQWHFAAMPGEMFNRLSQDALTAQITGGIPLVDALVLHKVPVAAARRAGQLYELDYTYLGEQAFEYNAMTDCVGGNCDYGQISNALVGYLANKVVSFVANKFVGTARFVSDRIGDITKKLRGEIELDITFELHNTDPLFFGTDSAGLSVDPVMTSGWSGSELLLDGVKVRVRQGLASFTSHTDENGRVRMKIAKNFKGNVCIDLENRWVTMTRHVYIEDVCVYDLPRYAEDAALTIEVRKPLVNVLAQMSDAGEFVSQRMGYEMPRVKVLVGPVANLVAMKGVPFAPCLGMAPNVGATTLETIGMLFNPAFAVVGAATAFDIIMTSETMPSRGVGVHEYGHTVMCSMMGPEFQAVFTQLMLQSASQEAHDQSAYIAEGLADFITSQVVGGTNYFAAGSSHKSIHMKYPEHSGSGLETDFVESSTDFDAQVRRVASLLHDFFDGDSAHEGSNLGIQWSKDGTYLKHDPKDDSKDDDSVELRGLCLPEVFQDWQDHATLLSEDTFLQSLARVAIEDGHSGTTVCKVFEDHSSTTTCPGYVSSLTTTPGSNSCSDAGNSSGGGGGNGSTLPPFEEPIHRN